MRKPIRTDRQFIAALAKGLQVLQCFTPSQPELAASDIARMTKVPQPTVWRICHTLIELGFLVVVPGRTTLRLGIPVLGLGYAVLSDTPIAELALPDMQALANRYQGAVSLGARDRLNMVYLQRCQGSSIILADLRVGSRVPLATSATGWAYLAGVTASERAALLKELQKSLGKGWTALAPRLLGALKDYERTGYVVNLGSLHPSINSVATPVRSRDGSVVLSLSSGGISEAFNGQVLARIGEELLRLSEKLSPVLSRTTAV